jgi:SAM-dependent methyltransferase
LGMPYEPTSYGIAREMLNMARVTSKDLIYDLGCGDGRILIMAAKEHGARGVGVDLDPERIRESRENAKAAGVTHLVHFFEQNLFETDIRRATVVMLYLYPDVNLRLRPKLLKEVNPATRIVSHSHTMGDWEDDATKRVEGHDLHFFVVPANVTGIWRWDEPGGQRASLSLTQKFQRIKGSMTIGAETYPITDCSLRGENILFRVERPVQGRREVLSYEGQVSGNTIQGKITRGGMGHGGSRWKATRDPSTSVSIAE